MPKCKFCKDEFNPTRSWQEFCSVKCRNNYHNDNALREKGDTSIPVVKCPYCTNAHPKMIEFLPSGAHLCTVCAREF